MPKRRTFIKQAGLGIAGLSFISFLPQCQSKKPESSVDLSSLPRSTPEMQGISSDGIRKLIQAIGESDVEFHSLMIIRNGHVVAEGWWAPYQPDYIHTLYSLSKSFTSTAVGLAIDEKLLTVEENVISFFPEDLPDDISDNLKNMKVKHLLTMSTGHDTGTLDNMRAAEDGNWAKAFLAQPVPKEPGTFFFYNTGASYMLSAIVQKLSGKKVIDYLKPRLFEPLNIEKADWEEDPRGINVGGYGLRIKTEDIAKLGLLYLQNGKWNGQQIISEDWVKAATSKQIQSNPSDPAGSDSDWAQGYGYQFWRNYPGGFRADGAYGQFSIVFPDSNTVIAVTSESFDMQKSMRLIWDNLLPSISATIPLAEATDTVNKLTADLEKLKLSPVNKNDSSPLTEKLNGKTFQLNDNELGIQSISFNFDPSTYKINLKNSNGEYSIQCGLKDWNDDNERTSLFLNKPDIKTKVAAYATWENDDVLILSLRYVETAHSDTITCKFEGDNITLQFMNSITKGRQDESDPRADIKGRIMA